MDFAQIRCVHTPISIKYDGSRFRNTTLDRLYAHPYSTLIVRRLSGFTPLKAGGTTYHGILKSSFRQSFALWKAERVEQGGQTSTWYAIKLDRDGVKFDADLASLRAEMPFYGSCQKCGEPVSAPGLDASRCQRCHWVSDPKWVKAQTTRSSSKGKEGAR